MRQTSLVDGTFKKHHKRTRKEQCLAEMGQIFPWKGLAKVIAPHYVKLKGLWRSPDDVEYSTLEWVGWFDSRRLLEPTGHCPPAKFGQGYYKQPTCQTRAA